MEDTVKSPRRYDASRRRQAAAATRHAILAAARLHFLEKGYVASTMPAIAAEAGVALDTLYASIGPKPALFRLLIETAISGGDDPVPAQQRDYVLAIRAESDPCRKIAIYAHAVRQIMERMAPLFSVLRDAARSDDDLRQLWTEISNRRAANMRLFAADLAASGGLRSDLTIDHAADIIWSMNAPDYYLLLVQERGWSADAFEMFLVDAWGRLLLPESPLSPVIGRRG